MKNIVRNTTEPKRVTKKKSNVGGMSVINQSGGEMSKVLTESQQLNVWTVHQCSKDMEMKRFRYSCSWTCMSVLEKCGDESINRLSQLQQQNVLLVQQC